MTVDLWSTYSTVCPVCPACVPAPPSVFLRTDHNFARFGQLTETIFPRVAFLHPSHFLPDILLQHEYGTGGRRTDGMAASARISQCQKFAQEVDAVDALLANICRFSIGSKCSAVDSTATPSPPWRDMHQRMRVFIRWRLR